MATQSDVLIVGGGILGCATAYFLAKEGIRSTILEREAVASCASGFAAGLLNPLHGAGIPGPLEPFAWESFRLHLDIIDQLTDESGVDPHFAPYPCMWTIFDDSEEAVCGELHQRANTFPEFPARWLDSGQVRSVEPRISGGVGKGMFLEGIRQVEPYQYTLALAQAAEKSGAVIRNGTVRGLKHTGSRITGVLTETGEIDCDTLVLAMGPWTSKAGEWLGTPIPVEPLKGQILRLQADEEPLASSLYRVGGGYIASKADGLIYAGTTEERVGYDDRPTTEAREHIMGLALDILPFLEGSTASPPDGVPSPPVRRRPTHHRKGSRLGWRVRSDRGWTEGNTAGSCNGKDCHRPNSPGQHRAVGAGVFGRAVRSLPGLACRPRGCPLLSLQQGFQVPDALHEVVEGLLGRGYLQDDVAPVALLLEHVYQPGIVQVSVIHRWMHRPAYHLLEVHHKQIVQGQRFDLVNRVA